MSHFDVQRRMMVDCQLRTYDVTDGRVLDAMGEVPRERFVAPSQIALAYTDQSAPAAEGGAGQQARNLLTPMVLARLLQAAEIRAGQRVLDVVTGTGYAAAVMARLGATVVAIDSDEGLLVRARSLLAEQAPGVTVLAGNASTGCPAQAPYDAILVNGSFDVEPAALFDQLSDGGRLVGVRGAGRAGRAMLYRKSGSVVSGRPIFDAAAPPIAELRREPQFTF